MPLVEEIIINHSDVENVVPGQIVSVGVDRIYLQDGNTPTVSRLFKQHNFQKVFNPELIGVFYDHSVLSPGIEISDKLKEAKQFAAKFNLKTYENGYGISHVVAVEEGWFQPGNLVIATDSHTCTGGVVQSLALGMGASDVAAAMVTGKTWLRVPQTVWINIYGKPSVHTTAKDIILYLLSRYSETSFLYKSLEWYGNWPESLTFDQASTVANMAVEMGAKCVFLPPFKKAPKGMRSIQPDVKDLNNNLSINIDGLSPFVAPPHSPFNALPLEKCSGQKIDYVFVGSCANSRIEDIAEVAEILKNNKIKKGIHFLVTPGSRKIYIEAIKKGYIETIIQSGAIVTPPGCGACVGTQGYIPATGDNVLSTMNRNFLGRMGNSKASIWLASPKVAAYTGLLGAIPTISEMD